MIFHPFKNFMMHKNLNSKGIMFYTSIIIAIVSVVLYQIFQKGISASVNPLISIIITYSVALIFSIILYFIFPAKENFVDSVKNANYASYLLGIAIIGTEIGFLLIYRSGWKISLAAPFTSAITNTSLIIIGLLAFKDHISGLKLIGLLFCVVGVLLISLKS